MTAHSHRRPPIPRRYGWWRTLHSWQRVLVVGVLLGVLVIAAGLIYFEPGATAAPTPVPIAPGGTVTAGPRYPPGIDEDYYWGQNKPLDQQP
jgi:hypothetical protein